MKKHLYDESGIGINGGIRELDSTIKTFVDNVYDNFNEYLDADLELYILEEVMSQFCYKRIQCQVKHKTEVLK